MTIICCSLSFVWCIWIFFLRTEALSFFSFYASRYICIAWLLWTVFPFFSIKTLRYCVVCIRVWDQDPTLEKKSRLQPRFGCIFFLNRIRIQLKHPNVAGSATYHYLYWQSFVCQLCLSMSTMDIEVQGWKAVEFCAWSTTEK